MNPILTSRLPDSSSLTRPYPKKKEMLPEEVLPAASPHFLPDGVPVRRYPLRLIGFLFCLLAALGLFATKLIFMQVFRADYLEQIALKQHNRRIRLEPVRGTVSDRRLRPLAVNVPVYSLYANPRMMSKEAKDRAVEALAPLLKTERDFLQERLSRDKYFVWLGRKLPMETVTPIKALKIEGLDFVKESQRFYPNKFLAAHVLGFAGIDNVGLEGIELQYNSFLKGKEGWSQILRDARQRELLLTKDFVPPRDGFNLVLTLDETIQFITEKALDKAFREHNALSASVVVMDPWTGEILALANRPTYNLETFSKSSTESRTNRAIAHVYEPGSVFKIVTAAAALEEDAFQEDDTIFCENGEYRVANHILHDHRPHGQLTFQQVIEQSSNIGTTKIAQNLGPERIYRMAQRFGFGIKTGIDLQGEVAGTLKPPSQWSKTSIAAIPIGHEVTVTPLQLVRAVAAVANGGLLVKPFVVKYIVDNHDQIIERHRSHPGERILSESTAERLKAILQGVVERGTGRRARIEGVAVAGKTGTSQKVIDGRYSHTRFYASFIGFAPVDDPRVAVAVVFNEPHPQHYGGTVAAPVFKEIVEQTLRYLDAQTVSAPLDVP